VLSTPPAFVLSQNQTLQTKTTHPKRQAHRNQRKSDLTKRHQKLASKKQPPPQTGRRGVPHRDGQKQQTKTTKHTIEFSNNTPALTAHEPTVKTVEFVLGQIWNYTEV
jgi:hypothetical protein